MTIFAFKNSAFVISIVFVFSTSSLLAEKPNLDQSQPDKPASIVSDQTRMFHIISEYPCAKKILDDKEVKTASLLYKLAEIEIFHGKLYYGQKTDISSQQVAFRLSFRDAQGNEMYHYVSDYCWASD